METTPATTLNFHHNQHPPRLSPPPTANLRRQYHNVRFTMPMRNFTLRRITTIPHPFRPNHGHQSNLFSLNNNIVNKSMADQSKNMAVQPGNIDSLSTTSDVGQSKEKEWEKSTPPPPPPPPPPPEKPLPGDCCGSGCVRCVWDVYFEELEDYDKICKANNFKPS